VELRKGLERVKGIEPSTRSLGNIRPTFPSRPIYSLRCEETLGILRLLAYHTPPFDPLSTRALQVPNRC
jgi:hypothetical protein